MEQRATIGLVGNADLPDAEGHAGIDVVVEDDFFATVVGTYAATAVGLQCGGGSVGEVDGVAMVGL